MTEKLTKTIKEGLNGFQSILKTIADPWTPDKTTWLKQIAASGRAFKEVSNLPISQRKTVREAISTDLNNLSNFYMTIRADFPDLDNNKEKHSAFFNETFLSKSDILFEAFENNGSMMTDDSFAELRRKLQTKPLLDISIVFCQKKINRLFLSELVEFMNNHLNAITVNEIVIEEDRLRKWHRMRYYILYILFSFTLFDIGMKEGENSASISAISEKLNNSESYYGVIYEAALFLFKSGHTENWIKRVFQQNFDELEKLLDDKEKGLEKVQEFVEGRWRELTGLESRGYAIIVLRAHIPKSDKELPWRMAGYKIFDPKQCIVAENLYPRGQHGTSVDICVAMLAPWPDTNEGPASINYDAVLPTIKEFSNKADLLDNVDSGRQWTEKVADCMKPVKSSTEKTLFPLMLFMNSIPSMDRVMKEPERVYGYPEEKKKILAEFSNSHEDSVEVITYTNHHNRLTLKTVFTMLYSANSP